MMEAMQTQDQQQTFDLQLKIYTLQILIRILTNNNRKRD